MEVAHGFQYVHSFEKHRAAIKQVVYNRQTKKFVSLDMKGLRMWDLKREHKAIRFKKDNFIQAIIYLETRQCYLAAAMDMSIKVYNHNLEKVNVSKDIPDITIEERALTSIIYDLNTDTVVTGSVRGAHIWNFRGSRFKRASKDKLYALDWLEMLPGSEGKWVQRVDFGPVTTSPIDELLKSRRVHCSYENNMLIYNLEPNHDKSTRYKYHIFNERKGNSKQYGNNNNHDKDVDAEEEEEEEETLQDVLTQYQITESQFRAWNDLNSGKPVNGLKYVVNFVPHVITKLADLKKLHEHSITGVVRNEKLGYLITSSLDLELKIWNTRNDYSVVKVLSGHAKPISGLVPHPTFGLLVSSGMDCTIRVWSLLTLKEEYSMETQEPVCGCFYAHTQPAYNNKPISPLITVIGNTVVVWNHHELTNLFSVVRSAPSSIIPYSNCIFVRCHDKSARLLRVHDGETMNTLLPDDAVTLMKTLLYNDNDSENHYFGLLENGKIFTYNGKKTSTAKLSGRWGGDIMDHGDLISCIAICNVVPCETQHEYHGPALEIENGNEASSIDPPNSNNSNSNEDNDMDATLPKKTFLVAGTSKGHLVFYDVNGNGEIYTHFIAHKDPITQVYVDTSRSLLLCMVKDEFLIVVSVRQERTLMQINLTEDEVVPNAITCFHLSQIEPLALIGLSTGYFDILNVKSNIRARDQEKNDIIQHKAPVTIASFLDRFNIVATGSLDCTIKLWTSNTLVLLTEIPFTTPIRAISFTGNEGNLLVGEKRDVFLIKAKAYRLWKILHKFGLAKQTNALEDGLIPPVELSLSDSMSSSIDDSFKEMDATSMWKHILPPEDFEKKIKKPTGRKSMLNNQFSYILDEEENEDDEAKAIAQSSLPTIPRLNDDKDLMKALKRIKKSRAKKMQVPFPKHLPKNYPRPPVGNNALRRRNNTKNNINKLTMYGGMSGSNNRPGRSLINNNNNNNTISGLKIASNSSAIGRKATPGSIGIQNVKQSTTTEGEIQEDYNEQSPQAITVVDVNKKSASRKVAITKKRWKRNGRKTTKRPPVYQLPPNKPAFVPTAEPWSKSVYGDIEGNATNDNNIMIDGGNSSLKKQEQIIYGEPW